MPGTFCLCMCTCMCVRICDYRCLCFMVSLWCVEDKPSCWSLPSVLVEIGSFWPVSFWDSLPYTTHLTAGAQGLQIILKSVLGFMRVLWSELSLMPLEQTLTYWAISPASISFLFFNGSNTQWHYTGRQHLKVKKFTTSLGKDLHFTFSLL